MQKIVELKNYDTFVKEMNENCTQKKNDVAAIVDKIKKKYGETARDFIATVSKEGVDAVKDYIVQTVQPINRIKPRELNPDYDNILTGLVCWILLELQLEKDK